MRDDRHGIAGRSHTDNPRSRATARTSDLVRPASTIGNRAPTAAAASWPGRWSPRSSTFTPSTTVAPRSARDRTELVHQRRLAPGAPVGVRWRRSGRRTSPRCGPTARAAPRPRRGSGSGRAHRRRATQSRRSPPRHVLLPGSRARRGPAPRSRHPPRRPRPPDRGRAARGRAVGPAARRGRSRPPIVGVSPRRRPTSAAPRSGWARPCARPSSRRGRARAWPSRSS